MASVTTERTASSGSEGNHKNTLVAWSHYVVSTMQAGANQSCCEAPAGHVSMPPLTKELSSKSLILALRERGQSW